jgi:signal transduction histidine kinase
MKLFRSVTSRLVFFYCLLLALLGGAFMLYTVLSFRHYTRETVTNGLSIRTQEIWNTVENSLDDPVRVAETMSKRFAPEGQDRFIRIRHGTDIIYRSGEPADHSFSSSTVPLAPPGPAHLIGNLLVSTNAFYTPNGTQILVDSGQSYVLVKNVEGQLAESVFVGLPVLLLLAGIAGYVLMQGALKPVEEMIKAAESYSFSDSQKRLPLIGTDPRLEALGLALNRMLDRLDAAYEHVSRFSADAAHELRTPLTIIRGELELAMGEAKASPDLERAISSALEEMNRLSGMVDSLVTLSRMESLWGRHIHPRVALVHLAQETIEQMNLLAEEKNISLYGPEGDPAVAVMCDRDRLKQVLVNLIDNAIKYTPQGGEVRVSVTESGQKAQIIVQDTGIGIDPAHHVRVFDRFYRVSTDRGESGAGLGLAIVRSICHAHGGTVAIDSTPGGGTAFVVELPLAGTVMRSATPPDITE